MVEYRDGSMLAQLGPSDMRVPIAHRAGLAATGWTRRARRSIWPRSASSTFAAPDEVRFPATRLCREAAGGGRRDARRCSTPRTRSRSRRSSPVRSGSLEIAGICRGRAVDDTHRRRPRRSTMCSRSTREARRPRSVADGACLNCMSRPLLLTTIAAFLLVLGPLVLHPRARPLSRRPLVRREGRRLLDRLRPRACRLDRPARHALEALAAAAGRLRPVRRRHERRRACQTPPQRAAPPSAYDVPGEAGVAARADRAAGPVDQLPVRVRDLRVAEPGLRQSRSTPPVDRGDPERLRRRPQAGLRPATASLAIDGDAIDSFDGHSSATSCLIRDTTSCSTVQRDGHEITVPRAHRVDRGARRVRQRGAHRPARHRRRASPDRARRAGRGGAALGVDQTAGVLKMMGDRDRPDLHRRTLGQGAWRAASRSHDLGRAAEPRLGRNS